MRNKLEKMSQFEVCHFIRFYRMVFLSFRRIETKDFNSDACFFNLVKLGLISPLVHFQKGTAIQIEKALIHDRLHVSKVSWKFRISTAYNFAVIYPWNWLVFKKWFYFSIVSIIFSAHTQNFMKAGTSMNAKISLFVIYIDVIIHLLLCNLHDNSFNCKYWKDSDDSSSHSWTFKVSSGKHFVKLTKGF